MRRLLLPLAAAALLAAGCGDDDNGSSGAEKTATATATETATPAAPSLKDTSQKPVIPKPEGQPPTKLVVKDIVKGKGKAAKKGDTVTVQYAGVSFSNGQEFDASWNTGQPFTFPLGGGQVIPGWDKGIAGMKKGGRRELIIPPDLAYGPAGSGPIGPNETLVFVVDMEQIG